MPPFFMLSTAMFYDAFDRAGFLVEAIWKPSDGRDDQVARVDFRSPGQTVGDMAMSTEYSITYPSTAFVGLVRNETIVIAGEEYKVRDPRPTRDGSEIKTTLSKV